jgi:hypothetical protein
MGHKIIFIPLLTKLNCIVNQGISEQKKDRLKSLKTSSTIKSTIHLIRDIFSL